MSSLKKHTKNKKYNFQDGNYISYNIKKLLVVNELLGEG